MTTSTTARRQGFNGPGFGGVRLGKYFFTSAITGQPGASTEEQFEQAFANLQRFLDLAGASPDDVGYLTVFIPDPSFRPAINPPWLAMFPDETKRPARKTTQHPLRAGHVVQLQAFGIVGGQRQVLDLPGITHRDPLPVGVRIDNLVYTSVLGGQDPAHDGAVAEGGEEQLRLAFQNLLTLVERAGGTAEDVAHVWVFLREFGELHDRMIDRWLATWPEDGHRPARKTIRYDLPGSSLVQLQATAILGGGRENLEVPGIGHHDPIPLATKIGGILISSGVAGHSQDTYQLGANLEEQTRLMFHNVRTLMEVAGGTLDDIGHITILLKDYADRAVLDRHWREAFPDPANQPARYEMTLGLPGEAMRIQAHIIAALEH